MTVSSPYDSRLVWRLSVAQLISWGTLFYTFALLVGPVEAELGSTRAQTSIGFSLALLGEGLLAWPVGRLIDRGHERLVMTGGSLLAALCLFLHGFVHSLPAFYAVWFGLGVAASAALYPPAFAVVTRRFPHDFRRAIITMTFLGGLASTVFIPLSAWLISQLGWRHALWALAAFHLLICAPLHWRVLRDAPKRVMPLAADGATATTRNARTASQHLRSAPFLLLGTFVVVMMGVTAALPAHLVSLLRENGLAEAWVIAIPASVGVLQVVGRALLYFFERHFDIHVANRIIPCLIPLGILALLAGAGHAWAAWLFVLLFGMGNGMLTIVKGTAIAQYVSREHAASLNGALGLPQALARAAAPLLLGVMWSREAGYTWGLWLLLAASVAGVASLLAAQRSTARRT